MARPLLDLNLSHWLIKVYIINIACSVRFPSHYLISLLKCSEPLIFTSSTAVKGECN